MKLGLKLGSINKCYTEDILSLYKDGYFQYIELFVITGSFNNTIEYWKQFDIPTVIHAPHSFAGMNLAIPEERENNKIKLREVFQFADTLESEHIIFHSGLNGNIEESINQLSSFMDSRCLVENKPIKGANGEKCLGTTPNEIKYIIEKLQAGFCLDFGHAICAANTMKIEPMELINEFLALKPAMYHLTDGDYNSEQDLHLHYGDGSFPIEELLNIVSNDVKVTNESKHDFDSKLNDFKADSDYLKKIRRK